ncbi:Ku protein [Streptomyces sp. NPDC001312]|uniref:Ku protein n=1 Tax=Streptomyces sp. NPDC001312 TaxID=3364561 RepID=UPI003686BB9A
MWTGAISFGLVSVPSAVLGATEDHSVRFRRIHTADNGLVRNRYWCEIEDREVSYGEIGQGYETAGDRIIPLTDEELRQLPLPTARAIELVGFLPTADVDPFESAPATTSSHKAASPPSHTCCCARPCNAPQKWRPHATRGTAVNSPVCYGSEGT